MLSAEGGGRAALPGTEPWHMPARQQWALGNVPVQEGASTGPETRGCEGGLQRTRDVGLSQARAGGAASTGMVLPWGRMGGAGAGVR